MKGLGLRNPVLNVKKIIELNTGLDPSFKIQGSKFPLNLESGRNSSIEVQ